MPIIVPAVEHHFDSVQVWSDLGGAVRVSRNGTAKVVDPTTGATLTVTQNGQPTTLVKADVNGNVSFTADQGIVLLVSGSLRSPQTSAEVQSGGASILADAQSARTGAEDALASTLAARDAAQVAAVSVQRINPKDATFGAKGDGVTDDAAALNAALAVGGDQWWPKGNYYIRSALRVRANTTITMHPECVILNDNQTNEMAFVNGVLGDTGYAAGYSGDSNITIRGGQIDNGPRRARGQYTEGMAFGHATNILVEGVQFRNNYASHFLEFNAVRNGVVRGCSFTNHDDAGISDREAINIDSATAAGFPQFGTYDNTACENILIEDNYFQDGQIGVGTHSPTTDHRNIRVRLNTFVNMSRNAVHAKWWTGGEVSANRVNISGRDAFFVESCNDVTVAGNDLREVGSSVDATYSAMYVLGGSGVELRDNAVVNVGANRYTIAYNIGSGTGHRVRTKGALSGSTGLIADTATATFIDGGYLLNLSDGTAVSIPVDGIDVQGLVAIGGHSTASTSPRGLFWFRADATPVLVAVSQIAAANVSLTTGALTGTTGTNGNVTVSVNSNGRLYVENRSGVQRRMSIRFLNV